MKIIYQQLLIACLCISLICVGFGMLTINFPLAFLAFLIIIIIAIIFVVHAVSETKEKRNEK